MGEVNISIKIWELYVSILPGGCPSLLWLHFDENQVECSCLITLEKHIHRPPFYYWVTTSCPRQRPARATLPHKPGVSV